MNNDLISREALKKVIAEWKYHGFYDKLIEIIDNAPTIEFPEQITIKCDTEEDKQELLSLIANAKVCRFDESDRPQADIFPMEIVAGKCPIETGGNCPLRSQGEWIFVAENELARSMDGEKLTTYKCPLCERMLTTFPSKLTDYPYCHCGADMRKGGSE